MKILTSIVAGAVCVGAGLVVGCQSSLVPLRPVERVETWEPLVVTTASAGGMEALTTMGAGTQGAASQVAASGPASGPATQATTGPATQGMRKVVKIVDPNQTARFVYKANYDRIWQEAMQILAQTGFALDRKDYRLGVLTTKALPSSQILEFWKPQQTDANTAMENTVNSQRRTVRVTVAKVPGKPEFYEIGIQVLVERETNPSEKLGGPIFTEGSGFGRSELSLSSDYAPPKPEPAIWVPVGHDPKLEKKLLDQLFDKI
jgi:hypothetical protein